MPKYFYKCKKCEKTFEKWHSITIKLTECECEEKGKLERIPRPPRIFDKTKKQAGKIVKEFIKNAKEEIKREKEQLENERNSS